MSEFSESYHLRSHKQEDGTALIRQCDLTGYVFAPANSWVTVLSEGQEFVPNTLLIGTAKYDLLHCWCAEDGGWGFTLYRRGQVVSQFDHQWGGCDSPQRRDEMLDIRELVDLISPKHDDSGKQLEDALKSLFSGQAADSSAEPSLAAHQFVSLLGIEHFEWLTFRSVYDNTDPDNLPWPGAVLVMSSKPQEQHRETMPQMESLRALLEYMPLESRQALLNVVKSSQEQALHPARPSQHNESAIDEELFGTWVVESTYFDGKPADGEIGNEFKFEARILTLTLHEKNKPPGYPYGPTVYEYTVDPAKNPKEITYVYQSKSRRDGYSQKHVRDAIYSIDGDTLRFCVGGQDIPRPTHFTAERGTGYELFVMKKKTS